MANSVDSEQTAPIGGVCSGSTMFASILYSSVMIGNYFQKTTSVDDIFRCFFFLGALRVKRRLHRLALVYTCQNATLFESHATAQLYHPRYRHYNHQYHYHYYHYHYHHYLHCYH